MALQLASVVPTGTATGVRTTPEPLIEIPYESSDPDTPIQVVLWVIGSSEVSGSIKRVFLKLPLIYYADGTITESIPPEFDAIDYLSTAYSHLEISDTITGAALATFAITPNPQTGIGSLIFDVTAPDTVTDWEFYARAYIYKEIV